MQFRTILAVLAAPLVALAQQPNPFNIPSDGLSAKAGSPLTLNWKPTTQGTVTLILRSGSSNDLSAGTVIAKSIQNSGSYTWTPSNSITRGSDYAIEIVDDADPSQTNYTPYFVLDSSNTVASTTPTVTLGATSTTLSSQTGVVKTNKHSKTSGSSSASSSASASASSSGSATASASGSMMTSASGSSSGSASPSGSSQSASGAGFQSQSGSAPTANAAPRATQAAGMLGLVALGALAL